MTERQTRFIPSLPGLLVRSDNAKGVPKTDYKEYLRKKEEEKASSSAPSTKTSSETGGGWREYLNTRQASTKSPEYNQDADRFVAALQNRPKVQTPSAPQPATPSTTAAKPDEDGDLFSLLGNAFMGGINQVNDAWASAADFLFGRPLAALGWEDNPISKLNEYYSGLNEAYSGAALEEAEKLGGGWRTTATQLGMGTVAAIPDAVLAMMSGGTSLGGKVAATASRSTADLIGDTVMQMAKNPQYWSSFAREVGLNYEEAKADGASDFVASTSAVLTSLVNAGIEIGPDSTSGIQGLAEALKDGSKTRIRKVIESAIDEGKEEVLQGIVSRSTSYAMQGKDENWVSFDPNNQDAIINPALMATEFGSGAAIGGLLSGGTMGADYALRKATGQSVAPVEDVENPYAGLFTDADPEPSAPQNGPVSAEEYSQMLAAGQAETQEPAPEFEAAEPVQSDGSAVEEVQPEAEIERFAKTYGKQAEAVKRTYISGQDVQAFEQGYSAAYEYGRSGATLEAAKKSPSVEWLSRDQIEAAYGAGRSVFKETEKKVGFVRNEYSIKIPESDFEYMDALANASGTQIEIVAPTGDGGVNGWYKDGVIKIASDAQDSYAVVASHEVTHRLKEIAPDDYRRYQDYVMRIKAENGDVDVLVSEVQERYAKAGQVLTEEEAREEVAANFTQDLIKNVDRFTELADTDRNLATRLMDSLKAFIRKVKAALSGKRAAQDAAAKEAYGVGIAELEKAAKLWGDALKAGNKQKKSARTSIKTRFLLKDPVEETKTLIALHNLNEQKLKKVLNLGGFPMPSIAVTRTDIPHTNFGDITLVMDKSTVDPKADRKNKVYSADAWTPVVPPVEYEVDAAVDRRASARLWDLGSRIDDTFYRDLSRLQGGTEDRLNRLGGEEAYIQDALDNYGLKAAYLEDRGQHIDRVTVQKEKEKGYNPDRADRYDAVLEVLGTTDPDELGRIPFKDLRDSYGEKLEEIFPGMTKSVMRMSGIIRQLQAYLTDQTTEPEYETVTDAGATRKAVDDALDPDGYERWVRDLFSGIEKGSGIYNNKDPYTPSGNRRSFSQTHYPVTLENIVKAMAGQNNGNTKNISGFNGVKTLRAGMARRFKSIAEMHEAEGRLQNLTPEEADAVSNQLSDRMYDIIGRIVETGPKSSRNSFIQMDSVGEVLMEIADSGKYSVENIERVFSEYRYNIGETLANDVRELLFDVSQMPVYIFEAKPERVVRFDEVLAAILPDDADPSLADSLRAAGISEVMTYPAGDDDARARLANSVEGARFSLKDTPKEYVSRTDEEILMETDPESMTEDARTAMEKAKPLIEAQQKAKAELDTAWNAYKSDLRTMPKAERANLKRKIDKLHEAYLKADGDVNEAIRDPALQKVIVTERSKIYRALLEEYGAHKPGENPAREVKVPKKTAPNEAVGRFARTAMETESADEEFRSEMEREIASGTFSHVIESDKDAVQYAQRMKERGIAEKEWDSVVNGRVVADKNQIAVGEMLFLEAAKAGDTKRAVRLCAELCAEATRAGRTLQAVRLLKKMDGAGQLYAIERQVENLQKDLNKRLGVTKAPVLKIDEDLADLLVKAKTEQERERVCDMILTDVANQLPVRWLDKWNAWRYLAMLGNPRTHIRNLVGNGVFAPAVFMKNAVGAGVEAVAQRAGKLQQSERTKTVAVAKEYKDFAKADVEKVKDLLTGDTKEGFSDAIRKKQQVFKKKWLETLRVKNTEALSEEDLWFKSIHYRHALAQILAARKLDVSTLTPDNPSGYAQLLSARTAALKEAERATFQDASAFAAALNRFSKTNAGTAFVTEAVLPFKKTPINILKRGVEYSPIGLTTSIGKMAKQLADGDVTADVLNDFAAGLTGTMVLALGTFLASQGWLKGGYDDEREGEFDELVGGQEYALQFGDRTFTIDWAAPIALPLFVGAEVWNAINGEYENLSFSVFANALTGITEPMFNLSMLDGLNDTLSSVANADSGQELTTFAREIVTGYLGQAVPTLFGQVTRSTDTTRRRTYIDKNSEVPQWAQYFIQKQMNKIPFLSGYQQPYVDAWGREDSPKNWVEAGERALENFALPGYFSSYEVTQMERELMRVHEKTGEDVFPKYAQKYFTADKKRIDLTAEQYTEFQTQMGETSYDLMTVMTRNSAYKTLPDSEKAAAIEKVYTYAREKAKRSLIRRDRLIDKAYQYEITTGWMEDLVNKPDRTVVSTILEKTKDAMERKEKEE